MASHLLAHIGERVGKCFECEKLFGQSRDLKKHRATHSRKKNFTCILCQRSFGEARALKNHIFKPNCWKLQNDSKIVSLKIGCKGPQKIKRFLCFYIIKSVTRKGQNTPLNLTSECLKYPPEVRVQHETFSTICGTQNIAQNGPRF